MPLNCLNCFDYFPVQLLFMRWIEFIHPYRVV
jgi:hypothetical protein